jgi:hypothetical protein
MSGIFPSTTNIGTLWNLNGASKMHLLNEALSRARMRRPQSGESTTAEAPRSARTVAMAARRQNDRELGLR